MAIAARFASDKSVEALWAQATAEAEVRARTTDVAGRSTAEANAARSAALAVTREAEAVAAQFNSEGIIPRVGAIIASSTASKDKRSPHAMAALTFAAARSAAASCRISWAAHFVSFQLRWAIEKVRKFVDGKHGVDLDNNEMLALAVVRLLEIISEAARFVPNDIKSPIN